MAVLAVVLLVTTGVMLAVQAAAVSPFVYPLF
jgi:hypothetical protein